MTHYSASRDPDWHLPDPHAQPEFYADVPMKRLVAWVFDAFFVMVLTVIAIPFTAFTGLFFLPFLWMVIGFGYRVVTLANGSATFGMRMMAIEFRTAQGQRFSLSEAFMHTLGYSVSLSFGVLQVVSVVLMLTTARGQGLTDHVMGTVALNRRAGG
ncbi:MAG: hypothetical protein CSA70_08425 [Rhodobacterales bacterium]|nr:MAG: hypothetical protein CSA70_08425 [Rhodobacterales bacterium]